MTTSPSSRPLVFDADRGPAEEPSWPEVALDDGCLVLSSRWRVGGPAQQAEVVAASRAVWSRLPLPVGLLSYGLFVGDDGKTLLHHSVWTSDDAYATYERHARADVMGAISATVAAPVERLGIRRFRRYRSFDYRGRGASRLVPGTLVAVDIAHEEPRAKEWVDAVTAAIHDGGGLPDGALSAHLHVSDDGRSAFNYAEWTSADAHRAALECHGGRLGDSQAWERVRTFPGVSFSFARYRLGFSVAPREPSTPSWWRWG